MLTFILAEPYIKVPQNYCMANNYGKIKLRLSICYSMFTGSISSYDWHVSKYTYICKNSIIYVYIALNIFAPRKQWYIFID